MKAPTVALLAFLLVARPSSARAEPDDEAKVSHVVFVLPSGAPKDVAVVVDGTPLSREALDVALPMAPGTHTLRVEAKGKKPYAMTITVGTNAEDQRVTLPELEPEPEPLRVAPAPAEHAAAPRSLGAQRTVALAAGGAGIVALGVGTFFGVRAIGQSDDARSMCDPAQCTSRDAIARSDDAKSSATIANIAFVAGAALVITGIVLWSTAPRRKPTAQSARGLLLAF